MTKTGIMSHAIHPSITHSPAAVKPKSTLAHMVTAHAKSLTTVVESHPAVKHAVAAHAEAAKAESLAVHPAAKAAAIKAKGHAAAAVDAHAAGNPGEATAHADAAAAAAHTAMVTAVHPAVRAAASAAKAHAKAAAAATADPDAPTVHEATHPNPTAKQPVHEKEVRMYSTISTWMAVGAVALAVAALVLRSRKGLEDPKSVKMLGLVLVLILGCLASGMGLSISAIPYSSTARGCFAINARERATASAAAFGVGAGVALLGVLGVLRIVYSGEGAVGETALNAGMLGVVVAALIGGAGSLMTMSSAEASTKLAASSSSGWCGVVGLEDAIYADKTAKRTPDAIARGAQAIAQKMPALFGEGIGQKIKSAVHKAHKQQQQMIPIPREPRAVSH